MFNKNNRCLLLEILHQHTGISKKQILKNPNQIDLKNIFETATNCETDKRDLGEFKIFSSMQKVVDVNLF